MCINHDINANFANFSNFLFCNFFSHLDVVDHRTNDRKRNKQNGGKNQDRDLSRDNEILNAAVTLSHFFPTKAQLIFSIVLVKFITNFLLFQSFHYDEVVNVQLIIILKYYEKFKLVLRHIIALIQTNLQIINKCLYKK